MFDPTDRDDYEIWPELSEEYEADRDEWEAARAAVRNDSDWPTEGEYGYEL